MVISTQHVHSLLVKPFCKCQLLLKSQLNSYLAKDCVKRFLLFSIAGRFHLPLFDCPVITNLREREKTGENQFI